MQRSVPPNEHPCDISAVGKVRVPAQQAHAECRVCHRPAQMIQETSAAWWQPSGTGVCWDRYPTRRCPPFKELHAITLHCKWVTIGQVIPPLLWKPRARASQDRGRGACEYVWCVKYCSSHKKTYWLSSGSQIFYDLDFLQQSSKWEGQLLGSAKYNLIPSTCNPRSLFSLPYWVQEGAVRTQIKQKPLQFGTALSRVLGSIFSQGATVLWQGAAVWLKATLLCDWLTAISGHRRSHALSGSPVVVCPLPWHGEKTLLVHSQLRTLLFIVLCDLIKLSVGWKQFYNFF